MKVNLHPQRSSQPEATTATTIKRRRAVRILRPTINVTPYERRARRAIGILAVVIGATLLASTAPAVIVALELLLISTGLVLVVTGITGHSPLYKLIGYTPKSLRRT